MFVGVHVVALGFEWNFPTPVLCLLIQAAGLTGFFYIAAKRVVPLIRAQRDFRLDRPGLRARTFAKYWLGQWKHPRYRFAGTMHLFIFAGFLILASRAFYLLLFGLSEDFAAAGAVARVYDIIADYAATFVFLAVWAAALRRILYRPLRYAVPPKYGKGHPADAIFLLVLIAILMFSESLFEASRVAIQFKQGNALEFLPVLSLPWLLRGTLASLPLAALWPLHLGAYVLDVLTFYVLLCYRPFGIQFHVETSLFNVFFAKLDRGTVKPVRWGINDTELDQVKSFGVKTFEDFTWKHMLDFYSCADCGRCSDNCPANVVGRPLSPRFLTIKARDYSFQHYPVFSAAKANGQPLIGGIYSEDEVWSCTTCGACEEECPLLIEYIDKIVDLRRGLVDDGNVPKSIQKALKAVEARGNPYGKMEKKRADWARETRFQESCAVSTVNGNGSAELLYFVDSITSYDDRIQAIGRATARILKRAGGDFAILGPAERDSGHDVRRFGEEMLFQALRDHNTESIRNSGAQRIVTADPHAYNALKHDYKDVPPVEHISQVIARELRSGRLRLNPVEHADDVYAYHDPCYLGRHNQVYDEPRQVLDAIPGLKRVEMDRCRDRSFCCGGGGLMLFYEPQEETRMGVKRVAMAAEAGANVIVTACPFCMVNIEDAIKVSGMEGKMTALDLTEVVERHLAAAQPENIPTHSETAVVPV